MRWSRMLWRFLAIDPKRDLYAKHARDSFCPDVPFKCLNAPLDILVAAGAG